MKTATPVTDTYELLRDDMESAECWEKVNDKCMPHFHQSVELVFVKRGMITAIIDGQTLHMRAGQLLICSSYTVHTYMSEEPNETVVMIIPIPCVPSLQKKLNKKCFRSAVWDTEKAGDEELPLLFSMMAAHWNEYSPDTCKGFSYVVLGMLIDRVGLTDQPGSTHVGLMKDVLNYLQENYQQPLRMEDLARHFGYSKSRFSRLFHDHLGCSMNEYVSALRCRQAASLLIGSEMTMLDIALNVGFECLRTFYRAFHACYRCTPSQYVRAHT